MIDFLRGLPALIRYPLGVGLAALARSAEPGSPAMASSGRLPRLALVLIWLLMPAWNIRLVPDEPSSPRRWYLKARLCEEGRGVAHDPARARFWQEYAA